MKFFHFNVMALIVSIFINLVSCKDNDTQNNNLRTVILIQPQPLKESTTDFYSGIIEEGKSVKASFMADGKISRLMVKEGDRVKKGQLLATLDDSDYKIGVSQLRTQLNQMTEEKKRMDEMFKRHNIAPNDYEKFSAGYEQLRLQMEMAENKLGYTKMYSPTDGYISEKFMEPGELVGAGTPIYKITDDSKLIANVDLPVNVFLKRNNIISTFGYANVYPDSEIPLSIESFTPDATNNMLYQMKLNIPSKYSDNLTPGMNIKVKINTNDYSQEGYKIPVRSITEEKGQQFVWIYNSSDSTISKKTINTTGIPSDQYIYVTGLDGNEKIVETGVKQLYDGEKVHIANIADYGI